MAIAGGATTAYWCQVIGDQLYVVQTTALRSICVSPDEALPMLARGERALVAGGDVVELRRRLETADGGSAA